MKFIKNYYVLFFPVLLILFFTILYYILNVDNFLVNLSIAIVLAYILSPKTKIVNKPEGKQKQVKWFLFKKIIYINFNK